MHPFYSEPSRAWPGPTPGAPFHDRFDEDGWGADFQDYYPDNPYLYWSGLEFHPIDWAERAVRHGERFVDRQSHEWAEATKRAADSAASGLRDAANRLAEVPEKSTKEIADTMKTIAVVTVVGVAGIVILSAVLK